MYAITAALLSVLAAAGPGDITWPDEVTAIGRTGAAVDGAHHRLCLPPLNDAEFVLSDIHFKLERRFTRYSGDISGRMLGALNATCPVTGKEAAILDDLLAGVLEHQKPDGHYGVPQDLDNEVTQQRDMPILWGNGRMLLALAERLETHPSEELRKAAIQLGDYVISTRKYYGRRENFEQVGGQAASGFTTCYPSLLDGLVVLGRVTGEQRFLDEARFIAELSLLDQSFENHHSHGRLVAYRGMLDLDWLRGERELTSAVEKGWQRIVDGFRLPTGGVTEMFDRHYPRDEGCSEADWIRVNFLLWRNSGNTKYLDAAEHAIFNHLLPTQFSHGGFGHWTFPKLKCNGEAYNAGGITGYGSDSYWCCSMHGAQVLADIHRWAAFLKDGALHITWLAEAESEFTVDGKPVRVLVESPWPSQWKVTLIGDGVEVPVRLRVPGWAEHIRVNGRRHAGPDGWAEFTHTCAGVEQIGVTIGWPRETVKPFVREHTDSAPARIFLGRDLFCLPEAELREDWIAPDAVPEIVLPPRMGDTSRQPVLVKGDNGAYQAAELVPIWMCPPGGCRYFFAIRHASADEFTRLAEEAAAAGYGGWPVELLFAADSEYDVYVDGEHVFHHAGWQESPRVTVFLKTEQAVVAVRTPSNVANPGGIGMITRWGGAKPVYRTEPVGWDAFFCKGAPEPAWLSTMVEGPAGKLLPESKGAFGAPPWHHVPAHYADSGARWIWPTGPIPEAESDYAVFRTEIERRFFEPAG